MCQRFHLVDDHANVCRNAPSIVVGFCKIHADMMLIMACFHDLQQVFGTNLQLPERVCHALGIRSTMPVDF